MADLTAILTRLCLQEYRDTFTRNGVEDWTTFRMLTEEDLKDLGVKLGHRRILQNEATSTHSCQTSSKPSKGEDTHSDTCTEYSIKSTRPISALDHARWLSEAMLNYCNLKYYHFMSLAPPSILIETFYLLEVLKKYVKEYVPMDVLEADPLWEEIVDVLEIEIDIL
ncbi:uncharacterized protein BDZ99DRAFT_517863 [Mytilinidion resinicola]|uniref:SAM domain-containing protein n=1 Tax=Mytilinidion resinicola TaxID=574789 RepID=A0A6A6Z069_9PEZI|nr:uncharacterized protein BDZ99DRAFT_517863 [Mytilinidion resinicola]KAF2813617.1 hypothetical protein BDZ99DRAFT_517863 [Mytilinidion resinicola]